MYGALRQYNPFIMEKPIMKYKLGLYVIFVCLMSSCISKNKTVNNNSLSTKPAVKLLPKKITVSKTETQEKHLSIEPNNALNNSRKEVKKKVVSVPKKVKISKNVNNEPKIENYAPDIKTTLFNKMFLDSVLLKETLKYSTKNVKSIQLSNKEESQKITGASRLIDELINNEVQTENTRNKLGSMIDNLIIQEELPLPDLDVVKENLDLRKKGKDDFEYSDSLIDEIITKEKTNN